MYISPWGNQIAGLGVYGGGGGGTGYAPSSAPATMDPIVITERQGGGSGWEGGGGGGGSSSSGGGIDHAAVTNYVNTGTRVLTDLFAAFRGGAGRGSVAPPPATSSMSALMPILAIIGVGIGAVVIVKAIRKRA